MAVNFSGVDTYEPSNKDVEKTNTRVSSSGGVVHLSPAEYVIFCFQGVRATARAIGRTPSAVSKWQKYKDKDGRVGGVPRALQSDILAAAKKQGLDITADDLIYGRKVKTRK